MDVKVYAVKWRRVADRAIFTNFVPASGATTATGIRKIFLSEGEGVVHSVLSVTRDKSRERELAGSGLNPWD